MSIVIAALDLGSGPGWRNRAHTIVILRDASLLRMRVLIDIGNRSCTSHCRPVCRQKHWRPARWD